MPAGTILIADDDAAIRTVLNQALGRAGYDVRTTGTAAGLWRWVSAGDGSLVITDVVLPDENGFDLMLRPERIQQPLHWRQPRRVFVNSMSDLFHKEIPTAFLDQVFDTMEQADWHVFQVLTKRSSLLRRYVNRRYAGGRAPANIWLGVTVEDRSCLSRIRHLADSAAAVRFISFEPLLEELGRVDLTGIHWAIAGGESGPLARPVHADWIRSIRDQCRADDVAFFFKQWGGITAKAGGNRLDGREWQQYPDQLTA